MRVFGRDATSAFTYHGRRGRRREETIKFRFENIHIRSREPAGQDIYRPEDHDDNRYIIGDLLLLLPPRLRDVNLRARARGELYYVRVRLNIFTTVYCGERLRYIYQ